jgi:hypothetical protein
MSLAGLSPYVMAKKYNRSPSWIYKYLKKIGIK